MIEESSHIPVLEEEVLSYLGTFSRGFFIDGTVGAGGHAFSLLNQLGKEANLLAIDRDAEALKLAQVNLAPYVGQVTFLHDDFRNIKSIIQGYSFPSPQGILLDLGLSSMQVDTPWRGFSYWDDGPLDMRMNREEKLKAYDIINGYSLQELTRIMKEFGQERWAERIASFILKERRERPLQSTQDLVGVVKKAIPAKYRRRGPHPARRTFMALRIAVNDELNALEEVLQDAVPLLKKGGRLGVISFHSLEDRIVKTTFQEMAKNCICSPSLPVCSCNKESEVKILTKKPVRPSEKELEENPRSRSASLRVVERI